MAQAQSYLKCNSNFKETLLKALAAQDIPTSAVVVARAFNLRWCGKPVTDHTVAKWLRGDSIPTKHKRYVLAQWLRFDEPYHQGMDKVEFDYLFSQIPPERLPQLLETMREMVRYGFSSKK